MEISIIHVGLRDILNLQDHVLGTRKCVIKLIITDTKYLFIDKEVHLAEQVGQGTFGTVYKALWRGCIVAAKVISLPTSAPCMDRIEEEIKACRYITYIYRISSNGSRGYIYFVVR